VIKQLSGPGMHRVSIIAGLSNKERPDDFRL